MADNGDDYLDYLQRAEEAERRSRFSFWSDLVPMIVGSIIVGIASAYLFP